MLSVCRQQRFWDGQQQGNAGGNSLRRCQRDQSHGALRKLGDRGDKYPGCHQCRQPGRNCIGGRRDLCQRGQGDVRRFDQPSGAGQGSHSDQPKWLRLNDH